MMSGTVAHSGPGSLAVINGTLNSAAIEKILQENIGLCVCDKSTWLLLRQNNDPKHTSKSTSEFSEDLVVAESKLRPQNYWDIVA